MSVFVELPSVVNNASELALVVGWIVGDADALSEKARVIGKVECAG